MIPFLSHPAKKPKDKASNQVAYCTAENRKSTVLRQKVFSQILGAHSETVPGYFWVEPEPTCRQTRLNRAEIARQPIKRSIETFRWLVYLHDRDTRMASKKKGESEKELELGLALVLEIPLPTDKIRVQKSNRIFSGKYFYELSMKRLCCEQDNVLKRQRAYKKSIPRRISPINGYMKDKHG